MSKCFNLLFLSLLLLGASNRLLAEEDLPILKSASTCLLQYRVFWYGLAVGKVETRLSAENDHRFLAQTTARSLLPFVSFYQEEESLFQVQPSGHIQSLSFHFELTEKSHSRKGKHFFKSGSPIQDKQSFLFALSRELSLHPPNKPGFLGEYRVVEPKQTRLYQIHFIGFETLKSPWGKINTFCLSQSTANSRRKTLIFFSQDKQAIPIKLLQFKDGKLLGSSLLSEIQWENNTR